MNEIPSVTIEREFDAPIDRVFEAWTQPQNLRQWFHASENTVVDAADVDLRVGGRYRLAIRDPESLYVVFGSYLRIEAPHVLEFTWQWEVSSLEQAETVVLLELTAIGDRTKLRLTHSKLSTSRSYQAHDQGWIGVLETLATFVQSENLS
jgi:uncharacterized protein YndB with AHSA1/START domain